MILHHGYFVSMHTHGNPWLPYKHANTHKYPERVCKKDKFLFMSLILSTYSDVVVLGNEKLNDLLPKFLCKPLYLNKTKVGWKRN